LLGTMSDPRQAVVCLPGHRVALISGKRRRTCCLCSRARATAEAGQMVQEGPSLISILSDLNGRIDDLPYWSTLPIFANVTLGRAAPRLRLRPRAGST